MGIRLSSRHHKHVLFGENSNRIAEFGWYATIDTNDPRDRVGQLKPNRLGLFDVAGNVGEWCWDYTWNYSWYAGVTPVDDNPWPDPGGHALCVVAVSCHLRVASVLQNAIPCGRTTPPMTLASAWRGLFRADMYLGSVSNTRTLRTVRSSLLPFKVLPTAGGSLLIDDHQLSYVTTGRDVLRFGRAR